MIRIARMKWLWRDPLKMPAVVLKELASISGHKSTAGNDWELTTARHLDDVEGALFEEVWYDSFIRRAAMGGYRCALQVLAAHNSEFGIEASVALRRTSVSERKVNDNPWVRRANTSKCSCLLGWHAMRDSLQLRIMGRPQRGMSMGRAPCTERSWMVW